MINRQTGRRSFLSSIAVLSAGVAFGARTTDIFCTNKRIAVELERQWDYFCEHNNGEFFIGDISDAEKNPLKPCKGHHYKTGKAIYFPKENYYAQPVWIYWSDQKQPSDVIINLQSINSGLKKTIRINRFELEAAYILCSEKNEEGVINLLMNQRLRSDIKTNILANKQVHMHAYSGSSEHTFRKALTYQV